MAKLTKYQDQDQIAYSGHDMTHEQVKLPPRTVLEPIL